MRTQALHYAQNNQQKFLEELQAILRIPSISTLPEHRSDINEAANWLKQKLSAMGLENAAIMPTAENGHPVVYADWLHAGAESPTVIVYGHYDVQPADPVSEWKTPPFEPTIQDDYIYGRGTSDNKGQFFAHVAAVEAYMQSVGQLPVNIKFLLEGEEEIGSKHLKTFIKNHEALLQADVAVISDTHMFDAQTPALITSLRGLVYTEIFVRGSKRDLHSGIYGGVVENPLNALVKMLASLHDEQNRVNIPHFYDKVRLLTPKERGKINEIPLTEAVLLGETGAPALWGETDYTPAERVGVRPTLDIHGIPGGFTGAGQKTVIPATASAKVSMRLVANQDAREIAELFTQHIRTIAPPTVAVSVEIYAAENGTSIDISAPEIQAAEQAFDKVFENAPVYLYEGGSIPVVTMFKQLLQVPVAMMGLGLSDDGLHSPNERFYLPNFYRGIETSIHYLDLLGQQSSS